MTYSDYAVIIAAHNSENVISSCINSALNLSPPPKQIIVVDDCSTDNTRLIVDKFVARNNNIYLYKHERNLGPSAARNTAISKSRYEICLILDSDDVSTPNRGVEHLMMHNDGADITFVSSEKRYISGHSFVAQNQYIRSSIIPSKRMLNSLLGLKPIQESNLFFIPACTMSITKSLFKSLNGFDEKLKRNEDADLVIRAAEKGASFSFSNKICVIRSDSFSAMKGGKIDIDNERFLLRKHGHNLSLKDYRYLEIKLNFRELYFKPSFQSLIRVCDFTSARFLLLNIPTFFRRLNHDFKKY